MQAVLGLDEFVRMFSAVRGGFVCFIICDCLVAVQADVVAFMNNNCEVFSAVLADVVAFN